MGVLHKILDIANSESKCLVMRNLLTNVTKTNEYSNVTTFVRALAVHAINAKDGAMRWKHEPGDFESTLPYVLSVVMY